MNFRCRTLMLFRQALTVRWRTTCYIHAPSTTQQKYRRKKIMLELLRFVLLKTVRFRVISDAITNQACRQKCADLSVLSVKAIFESFTGKLKQPKHSYLELYCQELIWSTSCPPRNQSRVWKFFYRKQTKIYKKFLMRVFSQSLTLILFSESF